MEKGLIHIYYGDGQGKTTAAFGLAFRCAGRGRKVVIAQFLKGKVAGEIIAAEGFPNVTIVRGKPTEKFTFQMNDEELKDTAASCANILKKAAEASADARVLVLDEVIDACNYNLLDMDELLTFLKNRPGQLEVVLTGHSLPEALAERADYITNMKKERHPFDKGIAAREDIEY